MPKVEFNKIPQIKIGENGSPGKAFGGLIYSSSLQIGVNGEPTRLTLNIVPDDSESVGGDERTVPRDFSITSRALKEVNRQSIFIGDDIEMKNMIPVSYSKTKDIGDKVLSVVYTDGSVLFDKVFVGLINRHYQAKTSNEFEYTIRFDALCNSRHGKEFASSNKPEVQGQCDGKETKLISQMVLDNEIYGTPQDASKYWVESGDLPVWVKNKATGELDDDGNEITFSGAEIKRTYLKAGDANKNYEIFLPPEGGDTEMQPKVGKSWADNLYDGALVVLGREEFKESVCDAAMNVSYSFSDLLSAIKGLGIKISKAVDEDGNDLEADSLFDRNDQYFRSYSGTLKEVLQKWCSDMAFGFNFDYKAQVPTIVGVDLTEKGKIDLDKVQKIITNSEAGPRGSSVVDGEGNALSGEDGSTTERNYVIESSEENVSSEETYQQVYLSQYIKGSKQRENAHKSVTQDWFTNVDYIRLLGKFGYRVQWGDTALENPYSLPVGSISPILHFQDRVLFRTAVEFMTSCGLMKYNESLRTIFNMRLAIAHSMQKPKYRLVEEDNTAESPFSKFVPLGITGVVPLTWTAGLGPGGRKRITENDYSIIADTINWDEKIQERLQRGFVVKNQGNLDPVYEFSAFLGVYDRSMEVRFSRLEQLIADFWGKIYRTGHTYNAAHWECSNTHRRDENVQYDPPAGWSSMYQEHTIGAVKDILENVVDLLRGDAYGTDFLRTLEDAQQKLFEACETSKDKREQAGFYWFERADATWGTQSSDVQRMLNPWVLEMDPDSEAISTGGRKRANLVQDYLPEAVPIPGLAKAIILADTNISNSLRTLMNSSKGELFLFFVPGVQSSEVTPSGIMINKGIDVTDLGQISIRGSGLSADTEYNIRRFGRNYPCSSGTSLALQNTSKSCTGAGDINAPGYNRNYTSRNLHEELSLLTNMCEKKAAQELKFEEECKTICERSLLEDACGKCAEDEIDFENKFNNKIVSTPQGYVFCDAFTLIRKNLPINGERWFYSDEEHDARGLNLLSSLKVIYPSRNSHGVVRKFISNISSISSGNRLVLGGQIGKNSTRRIRFLEKNVTGDLEQYYEGRDADSQQMLNGKTPFTAEQIRLLLLSTDGDPIRTKTLKEYHDFLEENIKIEVLEPVKNLSFKLAMGKNLPPAVSKLLTVRNGLSSFSYSIGSGGFTIGLNFSDRPPTLPELGVSMKDMGPAFSNPSSTQSLH